MKYTPMQLAILKKVFKNVEQTHFMNIIDFAGHNALEKTDFLKLNERASLDGINVYSANTKYNRGNYEESRSPYVNRYKKHYRARPSDTKRISNNAFSLAFITPEYSYGLFGAIEVPSLFYEPDLEKEMEEYYEKAKKRMEDIQEEKNKFSLFDDAKKEEEVPEVDEEKLEKKRKAEEKRLRKEAAFQVNKRWRQKRKESDELLRRHRDDHVLLNQVTQYIANNGYIIMLMPVPLINSSVSVRLSRYFEEVRIYIDDAQYAFTEDNKTGDIIYSLNPYYSGDINNTALIIAKRKKQEDSQDLSILTNILETANTKPISSLLTRYAVTEDDLKRAEADLATIPEENEQEIAQAKLAIIDIKRKLIHNKVFIPSSAVLFDDIDISIKVPTTDEMLVKEFRVGQLSFSDINEEAKASNILAKTIQSHKDFNKPVESIAPTDLHQGHIVMLLTSGLMNGYIGKGADQHLIKGAAIKEANIVTENVDGEIIRKETDYYNVSITLLDSEGEFKTIK